MKHSSHQTKHHLGALYICPQLSSGSQMVQVARKIRQVVVQFWRHYSQNTTQSHYMPAEVVKCQGSSLLSDRAINTTKATDEAHLASWFHDTHLEPHCRCAQDVLPTTRPLAMRKRGRSKSLTLCTWQNKKNIRIGDGKYLNGFGWDMPSGRLEDSSKCIWAIRGT